MPGSPRMPRIRIGAGRLPVPAAFDLPPACPEGAARSAASPASGLTCYAASPECDVVRVVLECLMDLTEPIQPGVPCPHRRAGDGQGASSDLRDEIRFPSNAMVMRPGRTSSAVRSKSLNVTTGTARPTGDSAEAATQTSAYEKYHGSKMVLS
jgi:hypothetical protein